MNQTSPPLRWAGSKRRQVKLFTGLLPGGFERYVEPFFGSGCLFFALLPEKSIIADINSNLVQFYRMIRDKPKHVSNHVSRWDKAGEDYYAVRDLNTDKISEVAKAARFFYLNRHCFNAVYRVNRKGHFNVPRGTRTGEIPSKEHLINASQALKKSIILNCDFEQVLDMCYSGDFVYLDPPFRCTTRKAHGEYGYGTFDENTDWNRLVVKLKEIDSRGAKFLLSYKNGGLVDQLPPQWTRCSTTVRYHVAARGRFRKPVSEAIICNYEVDKRCCELQS